MVSWFYSFCNHSSVLRGGSGSEFALIKIEIETFNDESDFEQEYHCLSSNFPLNAVKIYISFFFDEDF
jgi:hypothetical protein